MNDTQKENFLCSQRWKLYPNTATYEPKDTDIILTNDGYLCIYEPENISNIVFIAISEKHKNTLFNNVLFFTKTLIRYGVRLVTVRNKKWQHLLEKVGMLELKYENDEYMIYIRK